MNDLPMVAIFVFVGILVGCLVAIGRYLQAIATALNVLAGIAP